MYFYFFFDVWSIDFDLRLTADRLISTLISQWKLTRSLANRCEISQREGLFLGEFIHEFYLNSFVSGAQYKSNGLIERLRSVKGGNLNIISEVYTQPIQRPVFSSALLFFSNSVEYACTFIHVPGFDSPELERPEKDPVHGHLVFHPLYFADSNRCLRLLLLLESFLRSTVIHMEYILEGKNCELFSHNFSFNE